MVQIQIDGKIAVVTGGASGIGYAIVETLAKNGATVVIADIASQGKERAKGLRDKGYPVHYIHTDIRIEEDTQKLADEVDRQFGGTDILVNNAGVYPFLDLLNTTEEVWDQVMSINLKGMYMICKSMVPQMIAKGKGAIINIGSNHADVGMAGLFAYSVSKGGVCTLTRNLAGALARHRIRVNCVNPGWVMTEKEIAERAALGQGTEWLDVQGKSLPLGRLQTGEDTAVMVLFLVSNFADQVTGQTVNVDGGTGVVSYFDK